MKVLLRTDVEGVGRRGDIVDVAPGFGRNYLLPRGKAQPATAGSSAQASSMRRSQEQREARDREAGDKVAMALVNRPIEIPHAAGEDGRLFGSVTNGDVAEAVHAITGIELDRKSIEIDESIRSVGSHMVMVKLAGGVAFPLSLEVVAAD